MNLCVIPARGGSKRIPQKNIKLFCGKPIIAWSIETALKSKCFDKVIVSTDDKGIAEVAIAFGAEIPFMRPKELSDDFTGTIPVIKHAVEWFENINSHLDNVCCLYATAPFVLHQDLLKGIDTLIEQNIDYAFSVTSYPFPIQRALKINETGQICMFQPEHFNTRSQDLEEAYHDAGQFYWGKASAWKSEKTIFSKNSAPIYIPRHRVQDIDTLEDWQRAELMFKALFDKE